MNLTCKNIWKPKDRGHENQVKDRSRRAIDCRSVPCAASPCDDREPPSALQLWNLNGCKLGKRNCKDDSVCWQSFILLKDKNLIYSLLASLMTSFLERSEGKESNVCHPIFGFCQPGKGSATWRNQRGKCSKKIMGSREISDDDA